jgi:hypothetical protein
MAVKKVEHVAPKKQALTLDDVAAFVADARQSGAAGTEEIDAGITWGGKLQKLAVEVDTTRASGPTLDKRPDVAS